MNKRWISLPAFSFIAVTMLFGGSAEAQRFESEDELRSTVTLPADVFQTLSALKQTRECEASSGGKVSRKWFKATRIDLNGDKFGDLLVKSEEPCMHGPRAANWWIFAGSPNGNRKVFEDTVTAVVLAKKKKTGFRDIRTDNVMMEIYRNTWKYDGRRYKLIRTARVKLG
jgi:hypothetical protein